MTHYPTTIEEYELALRRLMELESLTSLPRHLWDERDELASQVEDYERIHFPDENPMFIYSQ